MKIRVASASELDAGLLRRWQELRAGDPALASPFFDAHFTRSVAQVRRDVRIAVLEEAGQVCGFFPHQRSWGGGAPVGDYLSDHHGLVVARDTPWEWPALLRGCGLGFWNFHHLCASQRPAGDVGCELSPALDLGRGFASWFQGRVGAGARRLAELPRKARKLAREIGPLRLEVDVRDARVLDWVIARKSAQCRRTGARDCFEPRWARELVRCIASIDEAGFAGRVSALYAGDELVAAHFGMRSRSVWHWWFPAYEHAHAHHSPGAILLLHLAQAAAASGHASLDLGKGDEPYKRSFADAGSTVLQGCVQRPALTTQLRTARKRLGRWLRTSRLAMPMRPVLRRLGRM